MATKRDDTSTLSVFQRRVLSLLRRGHKSDEIAALLKRDPVTIDICRHKLKSILGTFTTVGSRSRH